jgi:hypothetical protein
MEFLRTELAVAQVYADLAERQRKSGHVEAAERSLAESETSYRRMRRALYLLRNTPHVTILEQTQIAARSNTLRMRLDALNF